MPRTTASHWLQKIFRRHNLSTQLPPVRTNIYQRCNPGSSQVPSHSCVFPLHSSCNFLHSGLAKEHCPHNPRCMRMFRCLPRCMSCCHIPRRWLPQTQRTCLRHTASKWLPQTQKTCLRHTQGSELHPLLAETRQRCSRSRRCSACCFGACPVGSLRRSAHQRENTFLPHTHCKCLLRVASKSLGRTALWATFRKCTHSPLDRGMLNFRAPNQIARSKF